MANVRTVSVAELNGFEMPGIVVRDHFRRVPENRGGPHYGLGPLRTLADTTIPQLNVPLVSYGKMVAIRMVGRRNKIGPAISRAKPTAGQSTSLIDDLHASRGTGDQEPITRGIEVNRR